MGDEDQGIAGAAGGSARPPSAFELARIGVRLRWRLIGNLRVRSGRRRRRWAALLVSALYALGTLAALVAARIIDDEGAQQTLVIVATSMALGWVFGPILSGGVDETVDPTRLALLPLTTRQLFTVQLASAAAGNGTVAALVGLGLGVPIACGSLSPWLPLVLVSGPLTVMLVLGMGRSVAALLVMAQRSRLGRDVSVLVASLLAGAMLVAAQLGGEFDDGRGARVLSWLAWAPWSWPGRIALAVRFDEPIHALAWLAASLVACAAVVMTWAGLSAYLLVNGEVTATPRGRSRGRVLGGANSVLGAAMACQGLYLMRSPNSRVSFVFGVVFGMAFSVVQVVQRGATDLPSAPLGALLAMIGNLGAASNVLGFDARSLWLEVLAGGPGRRHLAARSLLTLPNLVIPTLLTAVVLGFWTHEWRTVGVVVAVTPPVGLVVVSVGLVLSLVWPWPVPDSNNPFANRQANQGQARLALVAGAAVAGSVMLAAPLVAATYALRHDARFPLAVLVGYAWAVALATLVLWWAGRRMSGREPEYLEMLSPIAVN